MNWKQIQNKILQSEGGVNAGRNKKMLVLMPILLVIFIFVIMRAFNQPSPRSVSAGNLSGTKAAAANTVADSSTKINWQIPELYPTDLRDPMQANSSAAGSNAGGDIIIKGIIYSEDRPSAVIGDRIMHQGDKIDGVVIVRINKRNVEFEKDGRQWTQEVQQ